MANEKNLKPFTSNQSREEAVKNGQKGGIASGKAKREKKAIKDIVCQAFELSISENTINEFKEKYKDILGDDNVNGMQVVLTNGLVTMITKFLKGDMDIDELLKLQKLIGEDAHMQSTNTTPAIEELAKSLFGGE